MNYINFLFNIGQLFLNKFFANFNFLSKNIRIKFISIIRIILGQIYHIYQKEL